MRTRYKFLCSVLMAVMVISSLSMAVAAGGSVVTSGSDSDFNYTLYSDGTLDLKCHGKTINLGFVCGDEKLDFSSVKTVNVDMSGVSMSDLDFKLAGFDCGATKINVYGAQSGTVETFQITAYPNVESITLPSNITYKTLQIDGVKIKNIDFLKNLTVNNLTLSNCYYITTATIRTANSKFAAYNCNSLETVVFPSTMDRIHFKGMADLKNVTLPTSTLEYYWVDCACATITVPKAQLMGITGSGVKTVNFASNVDKIPYDAFENCTSLTTLNIPTSVKTIESGAFTNCTALKTVNYAGTEAQWKKVSVSSSSGLGSAKINYNGGGSQTKNGWVTESGVKRYYENGKAVTGWKEISNSWYYFNSTGDMQIGWQEISKAWYYLGTDGVMKTRWQQIGGKWYYFNTSGVMQTRWQQISGKWYYFNTSGDMVKGWKAISGKWYYFNPDGDMVTSWKQIGGTWYYFETSGAMVTGWKAVGGKWYYFNSDGSMKTGWLKIGSSWYYLVPLSGEMVTGSRTINGKTYNFRSDGVCTNP